ncbi:T-complex protein 11-domain-containing protein [Nemania serpens]|nr:T-complex protein 11-domain-containing protein [Nemania serpens]
MPGSVLLPLTGSEELNHLNTGRPLEPPVTKSTLSELDVTKIISNPKLRDDINFDPELHFRPNLDGNKGQRKRDVALQFWAMLLQDSMIGGGPHSGLHTSRSLFVLLEYMKETLVSVVAPSDGVYIRLFLDVKSLVRQITRNIAEIKWLAEWLRVFLKQSWAPLRDDAVDRACDMLNESAEKNDSRILVGGMQSLLDVLKSVLSDAKKGQMIRHSSSEDANPFTNLMTHTSTPSSRYDSKSMRGRFSRSRTLSARASEWTIYGRAMGILIAALPDSGADACFISPETAMLLGLSPRPGTERPVKLANGKEFMSPGSVDLSWNFLNEEETFDITCWILPGCAHQVILGSKFLEKTKSLTTLRRRIQRKYISIPQTVCVKLLGERKQRLWGYLNDHFVAALPDTGSDVMIISRDYALRLGLKIEAGPEDIVEVEFADGTTALTDGIVRDAVWSSGGHSIRSDFLVLDNLCVDVVLSKDYLFEMDVFSKCRAYLTEDDDVRKLDICGIRLVRVFGENSGAILNQLEDDSIEDVISQDAFSPAMINREWARRDRIRDEIEALDDNRRAETEAAEAQRQDQWERARAAHRQRWAQAPSPSQLPASTARRRNGSPQSSNQAPAGSGARPPLDELSPPENVSSRLRWPKRARISIPLLPIRRNAQPRLPENTR